MAHPLSTETTIIAAVQHSTGYSVAWADGRLTGDQRLSDQVLWLTLLGTELSLPSGPVKASITTALGAAAAMLLVSPDVEVTQAPEDIVTVIGMLDV